jgi:hypothetical protein
MQYLTNKTLPACSSACRQRRTNWLVAEDAENCVQHHHIMCSKDSPKTVLLLKENSFAHFYQ